MFENMAEFVGYAMHDDLLARAIPKRRLAMLDRAPKERRGGDHRSYRAIVASMLLWLAARIAPRAPIEGVAPAQ